MLKLVTDHPIAINSPDHLCPWGTMRDNTTDHGFIDEIENYFGGRKIKVLDIGCSGGQLVVDFNERGHEAMGLEGSDYSVKHRRANWPSYHGKCLFTCDATKEYEVIDEYGMNVTFDLITAWEVLEHIHKDDFDVFFGNIVKHMNHHSIMCASIAPVPDVVDGYVLHQSVHPKQKWVNELLPKYFSHIQDLPFVNKVRYGDSFHVLLRR